MLNASSSPVLMVTPQSYKKRPSTVHKIKTPTWIGINLVQLITSAKHAPPNQIWCQISGASGEYVKYDLCDFPKQPGGQTPIPS